MRPTRLLTASVAFGLVLLSGCAREGAALAARYPRAAERILGGPGFTCGGAGFVRAEPAGAGDPADAALARRTGLRLELPENGADAATVTLPGGASFALKERGLVGPGRTVGGALAYPRRGGTSYWTATDDGFEEWVEVEDAGEGPVAEWEVTGATLQQDADAVIVADAAGTARARVTAPRAHSAGGAEARAWLRVRGNVIALYTDARGPALVDPVWTPSVYMTVARADHTSTLLPSGKVLVAGGVGTSSTRPTVARLYDPTAGGWTPSGQLATGRYGHTATLLPSGKVLVAGGYDGTNTLSSAELYDPAAGTWTPTGALLTARAWHTATLLPSGKVLVAAGQGASYSDALVSAELYDPGAGTWSSANPLATARADHTATLLPNGKVLVAGGRNGANLPLSSVELYDPTAGTWSNAAAMLAARRYHTATVLPSGMVLVVSGSGAERYDPDSGTWSLAGTLATVRLRHSATLLPSGLVLVVGGEDSAGTRTSAAELYDATSGTWSSTVSLTSARSRHTATLLPSGQVLVAGGVGNGTAGILDSTQVYDPEAGTWSATGALATGRDSHTATLLASGKVLAAGGDGRATAELYDPAAGGWSSTGALSATRGSHTATLLASGKVLVAGGGRTGAELYDPAAGTWSPTGALATARNFGSTATLLASGKVLVAGGIGPAGTSVADAELYDPATGTWSPTGALLTARARHTATLLPSGKVLVAAGRGTSYIDALASAELYDPVAGTWTSTGSLTTVRESHTATLLPSGKVLVVGGWNNNGSNYLASVELYDPGARTWTSAGSLATARDDHTATLLSSGRVLVAGGLCNTGVIASAELYDPALNVWKSAGALAQRRYGHTATLLPSGKVLVAGGWSGSASLAHAELFDEGRGAQPAWTPALTDVPETAGTNGTLTLGGTLFTGVSEASSGNTQSSATNRPLVQLQAADGGALRFVDVGAYSATSLTATLPATLLTGPYWVRVIVSGVLSDAKLFVYPPVAISPPSATIAPGAGLTFTASGGSGTGFAWSLPTNGSGGAIDAATGEYVAGGTSGIDVVAVSDSRGNVATARVNVTTVSISPASISLPPRGTRTFTASGGTGTGWSWALTSNASGGSVDSSGFYTAGATGGVVDEVRVTDSAGAVAYATVTVTRGVSITPEIDTLPPLGSQAFTASGGSGTGFTWSLSTNVSGGSIDATGLYTAGPTPGATDVVRARDSLGNEGFRTVRTTSGVTISPTTATVAPNGSQTFTAAGGSGTGFVWSLPTNLSGGGVNSSGVYTAGPTGGVTDVVRATDSLGNVANRSVTVTAGVSISPATATVAPRASQTFTAAGGSGTGFVWSLPTNLSGGGVNSSGVYTAGTTGGVTDVVRVTDSLGNAATRNVTVTAGVSISPGTATVAPTSSETFTASGGSGAGFTWSLATNASGGSIAASGVYTAGATSGVTDVVQVTDSLGNVATASVSVAVPSNDDVASGCGCTTVSGADLPFLALLPLLGRRRRRR